MDLSARILVLLRKQASGKGNRKVNKSSEETQPLIPVDSTEMAVPFHMWFLTGGTARNVPTNTTRMIRMARERNDASAAATEYKTARKDVKAELKSAKNELKAAYEAEWAKKLKDKRRWLDGQRQRRQQHQHQEVTAVEATVQCPKDGQYFRDGEGEVVVDESQPLSQEPPVASENDEVVPEVRLAVDQTSAAEARLSQQLGEIYMRASQAMTDLRAILESTEIVQRGVKSTP